MQSDDTVYDILGIGFGPSNLALAIALDEEVRFLERKPRMRFLDRQADFTWHGGMLLPDSHMQISFLKDLVSLRDPTSPFSFVNYLHKKGRLEAFINKKSFFPTRIEFNDYLRWVASHFEDRVSYGDEVYAVEPDERAGKAFRLAVRSRLASGEERVRFARNLVVAVGGKPHVPAAFASARANAGTFHSADYLTWIEAAGLEDRPTTRVAIVGRGQSAAEIALDLLRRFSHVRVDIVMRGAALRPADDSPFANEIFNPQFTDFIFNQSDERRQAILGEFRNTNYAVVDLALIEQLYDVIYQQRVTGVERLRLLAMHDIAALSQSGGQTVLTLVDNASGATQRQGYQGVGFATGYEREASSPLLAGLSEFVAGEGVDRSYRLTTRPDFQPRIYVQGSSEETHGLSDTLLSVLAVRSKEIAVALLDGDRDQRQSAA